MQSIKMFRYARTPAVICQRSMKNFGHKPEPVPLVTTIWHGFLTFTFIGCVLNWEKMKKFFFGDSEELIENQDPLSSH